MFLENADKISLPRKICNFLGKKQKKKTDMKKNLNKNSLVSEQIKWER